MIVLSNLSKKFNDTLAVENLNLKISRGEIIGLLGPNGAGKTTTLRMMAGVLPPTLGSIVVNDMDMKKNDREIKKLIGFLPENNPLYSDLTVEEYLLFCANLKGIEKKRTEEITEVLESTGAVDVFYRRIGELSKGYRQRVGLSQAFLGKPRILILDEPTEGLDPNQRQEIKNLILGLGQNRTVIVSSHILSEIAQIANRIIIIHKGKIAADDTPANLRKLYAGARIIEAEIKGKSIKETLSKIKGVVKVMEKQKQYFILECEKDLRQEIFRTAVLKKWTISTLFKKEAELEDVFKQLTLE